MDEHVEETGSTEQTEQDQSVADLTYEQARDELVRIVSRVESGQAPLEESMALWERGEALAAHCQAKLDQAQQRLDAATGPSSPEQGSDAEHEPGPGDDDGSGSS